MSEMRRNARRGTRPLIGIVPGDPNGIGPEVLVKSWGSGRLKQQCRPVVIGCPAIVEQAIGLTGLGLRTRVVDTVNGLSDDPAVIDVIESAAYPAEATRYGQDLAEGGRVSGAWLDHADRLARQGQLDATVMGPISAKAMDMAGTLSSIASHKPGEPVYLLLRSGRLVIAHLTDHIPLREVSAAITPDAVRRLIDKLAQALGQWGLGAAKIAVAGFNPHASGTEETGVIAPAVAQARSRGLNVEGPASPDSVFRHCIEGRCDAVIAMYHDQGHIALKTWGFAGNNVIFLGLPYIHTTVAHGVAYDIAGKGQADSSMLLNAILNAASLAGGKGFYAE
jgi:4-hydroxythreonine-4-phosphate dehydrogenase